MSLLEGVVLYEELGRALAPTPHFVSCVASAGALAAGGTEAQQAEWLPRIASGAAVLTPAWVEPDGSHGPRGVRTRATTDDGGETFTITGSKRHVALRGRRHAGWSCSPAPATPTPTSTCSSSIRRPRGSR